MINLEMLRAMKRALEIRRDALLTGKEYDNIMKSLELVNALISGDTIASLWSVEDVYTANGDCVIEPSTGGGIQDDGLTWFYCIEHERETLDEQFCEDHPPIVTQERAREVLNLAEREHDASVGINWDVLRGWLDYVPNEA